MSLRALTWALEHRACPSPSAKLVLMVFANFVDPRGWAWPSAPTVEKITGLNLKTVRSAIDQLEGAGLIADTGRRVGRTAQIKVYRLEMESPPEMDALPDDGAQDGALVPQEARQAPAPQRGSKTGGLKAPVFSGKDTQKREAEPVTGTITPDNPDGLSRPQGGRKDRGSRIPDDWVVPPIDQLPPQARAIAGQWPAGAYAALGEGHIQHFRAAEGVRGRRLDWDAAWHSRVVELGSRPLQDASRGMTFQPKPDAPAPVAKVPLDFSKPGEVADLGRWREAAAATIGAAAYRHLIDQAELALDDEQLIVRLASPVLEAQLRSNHEYRLQPLAARLLGRRLLRVEVRAGRA